MDYSEQTAKLVDGTYRNILEEFGPCTKQLVVAGKAYLKSLQGVIGNARQYTDALSRVAHLANSSTLKGSGDIGAALNHLVEINRELLAQQANIMKCFEFDFLEPIEIAADKDTKLIGKEQKRFQQMYKGRRENYLKCMSTLKKSKRKKSTDADKQIAQMRMMDEARNRLEEFCDVSLKEAIVEERSLYGTVLDRQCALSKQLLQYHAKGCELLRNYLPDWEELASTRREFPESCYSPPMNDNNKDYIQNDMDASYYEDPSANGSMRSSPHAQKGLRRQDDTMMSSAWKENFAGDDNVYAKPIMRAKSEFQLPTSPSSSASEDSPPSRRFSRLVEYNGAGKSNHVRALYNYNANGNHEMSLEEGDIIEFQGSRNKAGWQFGENLTSRAIGWFPVSYTEPITDGLRPPPVSNMSKKEVPREVLKDAPKGRTNSPAFPATVSSLRSKYGNQTQMAEVSEYGMPSKRKPLPVEPPTVSSANSATNHLRDAQLRSLRHHSSHPDISEAATYDLANRKATNGRK